MGITALGYIGVRSDRIEDWGAYASGLLGMQRIDRARTQLAFRMDDRTQRLIVADEPGDTLAWLGWEVASAKALDQLAARLSDAGHPVRAGTTAEAGRRGVGTLVHCTDPAGTRVELFVDPMRSAEPFIPGRPIKGFKTGPFGMGHAVLHVPDVSALIPFYEGLLGFQVSDYGDQPVPMRFFHVNGRHHSFATIQTGQSGFHHFMVEYDTLDDVGQGYDIALSQEDRIAYTMGRHTNDWATSFYSHTPSGFFVETGWGVRIIDPETWQPEEMKNGPSLWGHDRPYLPDALRERYRAMAREAAAQGLQAPPVADCPWLHGVMAGHGG